MNPALPAHTTIAPAPLCEAGNDSILARLDHEHLLTHEKAIRLAAASLEAAGGCITTLPDDWQPADYVQTYAAKLAGKASHAAWLAFEAIGNAAASFTAETLKGLRGQSTICSKLHANRLGSCMSPLATLWGPIGARNSGDASAEGLRDRQTPRFLIR